MSDLAEAALSKTSPLLIGGDESLNGHVRYRHIDDIMRDTQWVELEKEFSKEEALLVMTEESSSYHKAAGQPDWEEAMDLEIESIEKNLTWSLVKLPARDKAIGRKSVFKVKKDSNGEVIKHKTRLVAKGYVQRQGIDFDQVFALVTRIDTIRVMLAVAANQGWQVHHLDVKSAFLNGELQEEVYVAQPERCVMKSKEYLVYKIHKALYRLRQALRA